VTITLILFSTCWQQQCAT